MTSLGVHHLDVQLTLVAYTGSWVFCFSRS
jgi:hypothetical protein